MRGTQDFVENVEHPLKFILNALSVVLRIPEILRFALYVEQAFPEIKNSSKETNVNAKSAVTLMNWIPFFASSAAKK